MPRHDAGSEAPLISALGGVAGIDRVVVEHVASTGSTNADLAARAATLTSPVLRVADAQTEGRGRLGRRWHSQPGRSLTFSLAWPLRREDAGGLSLAVGVAISEALGERVVVKWPNDLGLVGAGGDFRKLGGILVEIVGSAGRRVAVVGVGLNVLPPLGLVEPAYATAALVDIDAGANAASTLGRIAPVLVATLGGFDRDGFSVAWRARFAARDALAGKPVRIGAPARVDGGDPKRTSGADGVAAGIADDGALRVRAADGTVTHVTSGEVSVRAVAEPAC